MKRETLMAGGRSIIIRPICRRDLPQMVLRCWPEMRIIETLFEEQEILGFAAWEEDSRCVAQLHCYSVDMADDECRLWPEWSRWWPKWNTSSVPAYIPVKLIM